MPSTRNARALCRAYGARFGGGKLPLNFREVSAPPPPRGGAIACVRWSVDRSAVTVAKLRYTNRRHTLSKCVYHGNGTGGRELAKITR